MPNAARFLKFWDHDRSLTALLVLLALNLLVLSPASHLGEFVVPLIHASLFLMLFAGILTMGRRGTFRIVAVGFVLLAIIARTAMFFLDFPWLRVMELALTGVCVALIIYVVALMVFREGPVTGHRIQGAVALYLLIAAFFSLLYALLEFLSPGALRFPDGSRLAGSG